MENLELVNLKCVAYAQVIPVLNFVKRKLLSFLRVIDFTNLDLLLLLSM